MSGRESETDRAARVGDWLIIVSLLLGNAVVWVPKLFWGAP